MTPQRTSVEVIDVGARPERSQFDGEVTFVGTATVLMRIGPFTVLTDPNFLHAGDHAPLGYGLRSRRLTDPAMELDELPPLDLVLLSHHHGDHFDPVVVAKLPKSTCIVTEPGSARKLRRQGFEHVVALETWESFSARSGAARLDITAAPARHAPTPVRWALPGVMGSVLDYSVDDERRARWYVTGDTLFFEGLREIANRYPDIELCIIHLGGTKIAGVLLTMDGAQGVRALRTIRPQRALPVHYDDYTVFRSPLEDFLEAVQREGLTGVEVLDVRRGDTCRLNLSPR